MNSFVSVTRDGENIEVASATAKVSFLRVSARRLGQTDTQASCRAAVCPEVLIRLVMFVIDRRSVWETNTQGDIKCQKPPTLF